MDQRTIGIYLSRILSGYYLFIYKDRQYKLVYPDIQIKYKAEIYAENEYEKNKFNDWITDDSIIDTLINIGMWSPTGDDNLKNIEKQIEDLKVDLYNNFLNPAKMKTLRRTLSNTKAAYDRNYNIRHSLDNYTPSGYANQLKNQYILIHSIYDELDNRIFKDIQNTDYNELNNFSNTIADNIIEVATFRTIVRNDLWRNYWSANSDNLFNKPTVDWTDEQKTLVLLTKMYDNAYQHPDCPPDTVFEDDDIFDGWMIHQKRENEKTRNKNRTEKMLEGKKLDKAGEVFIMANSKDEAKQIYDLNDNTNKHIINERRSVIMNTNRPLEDKELPDIKRNTIQQINEQFKNSRK
jgi:hypothetical protein